MKNKYTLLLRMAFLPALPFITPAFAQTDTCTFEQINLGNAQYWDGSDQSKGFTCGDAYFPNTYDTTYQYWSSGFAVSKIKDTTTSGYTALYDSYAYGGYNSAQYAVVQQGAVFRFTDKIQTLQSIRITNTTYAALSMKNGDQFAKKFGGVTGNDPDYFKLTLTAYSGGMVEDTASFYLADYRFSNNAQDYIVKDWTLVTLNWNSPDSIGFTLTSSDTGAYGINTPLFFTIDNVQYTKTITSLEKSVVQVSKNWSAYPIPAENELFIETDHSLSISLLDINGRQLNEYNLLPGKNVINIAGLSSGLYLLKDSGGTSGRLIKK